MRISQLSTMVDSLSDCHFTDYRIRTGRNVLESSGAGESNPAPANSSINILANTALQNFNACQSALNRQAKHWLGVGWIGAIVDKQGAKASRSSIKTATEGLHTFVSGPEMVSWLASARLLAELTAVFFDRPSFVVSLSVSRVVCELLTSMPMVRFRSSLFAEAKANTSFLQRCRPSSLCFIKTTWQRKTTTSPQTISPWPVSRLARPLSTR